MSNFLIRGAFGLPNPKQSVQMKQTIIFIFAAFIGFTSCKKDEPIYQLQPKAQIILSKNALQVYEYHFDASASTGKIVKYSWQFRVATNWYNAVESADAITVFYSTFKVDGLKLIVQDAAGNTAEFAVPVELVEVLNATGSYPTKAIYHSLKNTGTERASIVYVSDGYIRRVYDLEPDSVGLIRAIPGTVRVMEGEVQGQPWE